MKELQQLLVTARRMLAGDYIARDVLIEIEGDYQRKVAWAITQDIADENTDHYIQEATADCVRHVRTLLFAALKLPRTATIPTHIPAEEPK